MQVDQVITLTEQKSNLTESKRYTNVIRKIAPLTLDDETVQ